MKYKYFKALLILKLLLITNFYGNAQITNYIYAINYTFNPLPAYHFSKIEISTGIITDLYLLPGTSYPYSSNSCIDNNSQIYYFCSENQLMAFNPVNGNLISSVILPIPPTAWFTYMQFNPCDSEIYGIIYDYPTSVSFARYNPVSGNMTTIAGLNINTLSCSGCMSILDPDSGIFAIDNGNILGLNLSTGQIVYNSPKIHPTNEFFSHIALDCATHQIFGTSANGSAKFLCTIDPYTGIVSHVSASSWNVGLNKPALGGNYIDQTTGIYYYSGSVSSIYGADITTGNLIYNQPVNSGTILHIQAFSQCNCSPTGIQDIINSSEEITVTPNPFKDKLSINTVTDKEYEIVLYDIASRIILQKTFSSPVILNTEQFVKGLYFYEVRNKNGAMLKGKVIKE